MIPTQAYAAFSEAEPLRFFQFERKDPEDHEVLIAIHYCGICHSDIHQVQGEWPGAHFPLVPGHEITGIVKELGKKVTRFQKGDRVGVGCYIDSCRTCFACQSKVEQYCENTVFTYNSPQAHGHTQGGYSDQIIVDENYVFRIPDSLALDEAAPLLCAGITVYSPLKRWKVNAHKKVAVLGLGGLGHMAVKIASALGAKVSVFSRGFEKQQDAKRMGAIDFHSTSEPETFEQLRGSFDLILNTLSAEAPWDLYLHLLRLDGCMVLLGIPPQPVPIMASSLIDSRRCLAGSLIGGTEEIQEMLDFCGKNNITPEIERIPIQQVNEAYARVLAGKVKYRFVLCMDSLKESTTSGSSCFLRKT
jgi:uncharacterized zinc-type alcohol dehydrogenase-like protein